MRQLDKAPKVPGYLPAGPSCAPPSYGEVIDLASSSTDAAMQTWYTCARIEFSSTTGNKLAHKQPTFVLRTASETTNRASEMGVSTALSRLWRRLEQKARRVCRLVHWPSPTRALELSMLPKYAAEMARIHHFLLCNMRDQHGPTEVAWNSAFWKAMASNHAHAANSLRHMAGAKAKRIAVATSALNTSK